LGPDLDALGVEQSPVQVGLREEQPFPFRQFNQ
jgi:hypothetical protein